MYSVNELLTALMDITRIQFVTKNCTDSVMSAIDAILGSSIILHKSPIFVFTDAPPDDAANYKSVLDDNAWLKLPIYTFFLNNASASCPNEALDPAYRTLEGNVTIGSGGLNFVLDNTTYSNTFKEVFNRVVYKANYVTINELGVCSMKTYGTFFVNGNDQGATILATGSRDQRPTKTIFSQFTTKSNRPNWTSLCQCEFYPYRWSKFHLGCPQYSTRRVPVLLPIEYGRTKLSMQRSSDCKIRFRLVSGNFCKFVGW